MVNRKVYFNDFATFMVVIIVGSLIVGAIEGINIGRNVKTYDTYSEEVAPGDYIMFTFKINEGARMYLDLRADNGSYNNDAKVIFSIMRSYDFEEWIIAGSPVPGILNSTFYYDDSYVNINNLGVSSESYYYFIVYNNNSYIIETTVNVTIVPWGHIIASGIMAVLLLFGSSSLGIRSIHVTNYNAIQEKKSPGNENEDTPETQPSAAERKDGVFCQSCGAPLTLKDKRYCPQCGASV